MNHPRRARLRRLLLLVPLALLGAAWLVRARLPRPQTEGDKVLWELAEKTSSLKISFDDYHDRKPNQFALGIKQGDYLEITTPEGVRAILRALSGTSAFSPSPPLTAAFLATTPKAPLVIALHPNGRRPDFLEVSELAGKPVLYHGEYPNMACDVAALNRLSVKRFLQVLRADIAKGKRYERGYRVVPWGY